MGHVDHGKSTLSGRILKDNEQIAENEIRVIEQDANEKNKKN